jgi:hypothetical protein
MCTSPVDVVTVIALSLTLAREPRTGVMSAGAAEDVSGAVVAVDVELLDEAVESCVAAELSCFAHPASASSVAESVAIEVNAPLGTASGIVSGI